MKLSLNDAVTNLLRSNGGLTDSLEGPDTYVMVRRRDFEELENVLKQVDILLKEGLESLFPKTTYKDKRQLGNKEAFTLGHAFHEYAWDNCDHEGGMPGYCRMCVAEILAYLNEKITNLNNTIDKLKLIVDVGTSDDPGMALGKMQHFVKSMQVDKMAERMSADCDLRELVREITDEEGKESGT